jgi:hypothetical protein
MKNENKLKSELKHSLSNIAVPESLYRFADNVPELADKIPVSAVSYTESTGRRRFHFVSALAKPAAAAILLGVIFVTGVEMSPAFASYMKEVPGFNIAVSWLTGIREEDGVQKAIANGYTPIAPVTSEFGNMKITINDVYLTDDELLFKAFISTDEFDVTNNQNPVHLSVGPSNLKGGGSTTRNEVTEAVDGSKEPILQTSYKYQLEGNASRDFLASNKELLLEVSKTTVDSNIKKANRETIGTIAIPVDRTKLLHNNVKQLNQALSIAPSDPDIQELQLEKLTIQPTTMNAIIAVKEGYSLNFPMYKEESPYFYDDKGNKFPYNPGGPVLTMEHNKLQLPFSSSAFFDKGTDNLKLHIGTVLVSEQDPSGSFELSIKDSFPKTVQFKNKQIVIESADSHDGYLFLKIKKDNPEQTKLDGVRFVIEDYFEQLKNNQDLRDQLDKLRVKLDIDGWESTVNGWKRPYLELYIPAPKQDHFHISLQRIYDPIAVNKDFTVKLN